MGGPPPEGLTPPRDGALPASALASTAPLSAYVHVPYCRVRCGYCDFNTYTAQELGTTRQEDFVEVVSREIELSRRVLDPRPWQTVFFGGGTPTLLPAGDLVRILETLDRSRGLSSHAEVTVEANPDSVDASYLGALADAGVTRVSFGVQSAVSHVLETLDRTHDPLRVPEVVDAARDAGLDVSIDLIYGTPGESMSDWATTLEFAVGLRTDHISAYSLIVEEGTALARRIHRGELAAPDDDLNADMYEYADHVLSEAGFAWYEVSNWARSADKESRHNRAYWANHDWWGFGPGAHSHVGGVRWWNVKHPHAYAQRLQENQSPAAGRELLDDTTRRLERVMLSLRLREGLSLDVLGEAELGVAHTLVQDGLCEADALQNRHLVLTRRGRLLADLVVRRLTDEPHVSESHD